MARASWLPWKMRLVFFGVAFLLALSASTGSAEVVAPAKQLADGGARKRLSDAQIKKVLIEASISEYDGNCPCPYSRARNGSRCGKRSAYSREGGAAPLCFAEDVSAPMVQAYRDEHPDE